jgi:hypothetical protein
VLSTFAHVPYILVEVGEILQAHPGDGSLERKLNEEIEKLYLKLSNGLLDSIEILRPKGCQLLLIPLLSLSLSPSLSCSSF